MKPLLRLLSFVLFGVISSSSALADGHLHGGHFPSAHLQSGHLHGHHGAHFHGHFGVFIAAPAFWPWYYPPAYYYPSYYYNPPVVVYENAPATTRPPAFYSPPAEATPDSPPSNTGPERGPGGNIAQDSPAYLFMYPRQGQSDRQQAIDRQECSSWAAAQTGYDPSQPGRGSAAQVANYQRATEACLDARGYSVR
jgi:hypothetical protein